MKILLLKMSWAKEILIENELIFYTVFKITYNFKSSIILFNQMFSQVSIYNLC